MIVAPWRCVSCAQLQTGHRVVVGWRWPDGERVEVVRCVPCARVLARSSGARLPEQWERET